MKSFFQDQQNFKEPRNNIMLETKQESFNSVLASTNLCEVPKDPVSPISDKNYTDQLQFKIIDYPFFESIMSIWEKSDKKRHPRLKAIQPIETPKQKPEEPKKIEPLYSPYETFF